jgi:hypothetical protein
MTTNFLYRATEGIQEEDLAWMPLDRMDLPAEFRSFRSLREGPLDNETMAKQSVLNRNADDLQRLGRITGHLKEFAAASSPEGMAPGSSLAVATVVHLFRDGESVSNWMEEVFRREFEASVGDEVAPGYRVESAQAFEPTGLASDTVGMEVVQRGPAGGASSTVIDFRVGRLLGVAYTISAGEAGDKGSVEEVAAALERKMVRVVLGAS